MTERKIWPTSDFSRTTYDDTVEQCLQNSFKKIWCKKLPPYKLLFKYKGKKQQKQNFCFYINTETQKFLWALRNLQEGKHSQLRNDKVHSRENGKNTLIRHLEFNKCDS